MLRLLRRVVDCRDYTVRVYAKILFHVFVEMAQQPEHMPDVPAYNLQIGHNIQLRQIGSPFTSRYRGVLEPVGCIGEVQIQIRVFYQLY